MRGHVLVLLTNFDSMLSVECRYALRSPSRHLHRFHNARSMVLLAASFEPSSIAFSIVIFAECEHNFFIAFHYIHFNRQFNVFTLFGFIRSIDIGKCSINASTNVSCKIRCCCVSIFPPKIIRNALASERERHRKFYTQHQWHWQQIIQWF